MMPHLKGPTRFMISNPMDSGAVAMNQRRRRLRCPFGYARVESMMG